MRLVVVSGHSGAGKSVALRVLEDSGYYCVDNLPIDLLEHFVESTKDSQQNVAVSIDIRNLPDNLKQLSLKLDELAKSHDVKVLFLDATKPVLLTRYSETRRIHPLSQQKEKLSLEQAIDLEHKLLKPIKEQADYLIDSSHRSIHDLSETIRIELEGKEKKELVMVFQSFGFKYGMPNDADYVFDVRFLPNPHWQPELRPLTGLDAPIKSFLESHPEVIELKLQIQHFIERWLPMLEKNNRSYLTVAIGCTGGKHRSVYIAQQIGEYFAHSGQQVQIRHASLEQHQ
ncbi:RNase adaptor protein RapZ [Vibrio sp. 10N.286.49.C2]|uniref:RNase adapter RapZ n=1 Tax=unclassified Vibrio TaxID=2614977 RepID=UPI000C826246|nr:MULTISPECIES: RNase adapter RapZ [unclassified Vibrio]PMH34118.1 RNase adaptor protein RapZ [Vibrio sp. 10N.286.49.C2]PMH56827.1 RNase adaptor protein RapZ [Vibrio sp. 10N.286.49.B1]PMH83149.1 RNase adaptor protein RapZ [Vibrio sp. 10N.286.48.B7]